MKRPLFFLKAESLGNDFVLLNQEDLEAAFIKEENLKQTVLKMGQRHKGVGFDQLVLYNIHSATEVKVTFYNQDGSQAEACGNGSRALTHALFLKGLTEKEITLQTVAGPLKAGVTPEHSVDQVKSYLHLPKRNDKIISYSADAFPFYPHKTRCISSLSMGNPHLVLLHDVLIPDARTTYGQQFSRDPYFPQGTNVSFAVLRNPQTIDLQVWERGVGPTLACGTAAAATFAAIRSLGLCGEKIKIFQEGGGLDFCDTPQSYYMEGESRLIFEGYWLG